MWPRKLDLLLCERFNKPSLNGFTFLAVQYYCTDFEFLAVCFLAVRLDLIVGIFDLLLIEGSLETNGFDLLSELITEFWCRSL